MAGIKIDRCEWNLARLRCLSCGPIRYGDLNGNDFAAAVCQSQGKGCSVCGGDGNCCIVQGDLGIAGVGSDLYVSCACQRNPSFQMSVLSYAMQGSLVHKISGVIEQNNCI